MSTERKVGLLFILSILMIVSFAYWVGGWNPFSLSKELNVYYNFAGGVEVGSPVRVMGIKVGKVKDIEFSPDMRMSHGEEVKLKLVISVNPKAWKTIKEDSRFYINMAGLIGERFVEVTPGGIDAAPLKPNSDVRGEDPPRIDQLLSQGYGLAGKILEMVEKNEGSVTNTIQMLDKLVMNFNKTLGLLNKTTKNVRVDQLLRNMAQISGDIAAVSKKLRSKDAEKTIDLLHDLVWRLEKLDKESIKVFLQEEGIKARMAF